MRHAPGRFELRVDLAAEDVVTIADYWTLSVRRMAYLEAAAGATPPVVRKERISGVEGIG